MSEAFDRAMQTVATYANHDDGGRTGPAQFELAMRTIRDTVRRLEEAEHDVRSERNDSLHDAGNLRKALEQVMVPGRSIEVAQWFADQALKHVPSDEDGRCPACIAKGRQDE